MGTLRLEPARIGGLSSRAVNNVWAVFDVQLALYAFALVVMGLLIAGSLLGVYEHVEHNLEFALAIRPNAALSDIWFKGISGATPLLAPGILSLAAVIAIAATYYHPALGKRPVGPR